MAIQVEASKDIREYSISNIGPFDTRQVVCIGISLIYSVPIAILLPTTTDNKILIGLILALPVAACGFVKLDGCYFETLILRLIYLYILTPAKRKTIIENPYKKELKKMDDEAEKKMLSQMSGRNRKKYEKMKHSVKYSKTYRVYR